MLANEPELKPLQVLNPSFLKALNQSSHVGFFSQPQLLPQALQDGQLLSQALQDGQLLSQAPQDGQLLSQAPQDGQLLSQALQDGQLLSQVLHEAKPADAVSDTTNKTASKIPTAFPNTCFLIISHSLLLFNIIQL
jgi:hypothetical protein